jgi:hypothetical protein
VGGGDAVQVGSTLLFVPSCDLLAKLHLNPKLCSSVSTYFGIGVPWKLGARELSVDLSLVSKGSTSRKF